MRPKVGGVLVEQPPLAVVADRRGPGERHQQVLVNPLGRQALGLLFEEPASQGLALLPRPPDTVGAPKPATADHWPVMRED